MSDDYPPMNDAETTEQDLKAIAIERLALERNGVKLTDSEVLSAVSQHASRLFLGHWPDLYASQSEADFALMQEFARVTSSRSQVLRLFLASELGKREKAKRNYYTEFTLNRLNLPDD